MPGSPKSPWWSRAITAMVVVVWALWAFPDPWSWPAFVLLAAAWAAAVSVDLVQHELPDRYTLLSFPAFVVLLLPSAVIHDDWGRWGMTIVAALVTAVVLFVLALVNPAGLGLGDVKLGLTTGAALGWVGGGWSGVRLAMVGVGAGFVLVAVVGVVLLAIRRASRHTDIAFGPFMVAGVLAAPAAATALGWA